MKRPIGVTLIALGAVLAGLWQIWRIGVFAGIVDFTFLGKQVSYNEVQWGPLFWAAILAAIWFYEAAGLWNLRAYAWSFGIFVSIFTVIFGFFAVLGGSTTEAETVGWFIAIAIFFYLNYPGVRNHFIEHELSLMTPEQRAALEQVAKANAAAEAAMRAPSTPPTTPGTPPAS